MIRINLLPFRAARKKENIKRQITVFILVVVLFLVGMAYTFLQLNNKISSLKAEEKDIQTRLAKLKDDIKEIAEYEKKIAEITAKLEVIKRLEKNKTGPVHLLEEISLAVPKDKLWLKSFQERKGKLTLEGTAMDNETVALFMTNLVESEYISTVDLQSAKLRTIPDHKLRVSDFILECKTYAYEQKPKTTAKKKSTKRTRRRH